MAIGVKGTLGAGFHNTAASSYVFTTARTNADPGDVALLVSSSDNLSTTDGDHSDVVSVTDASGNTWTKVAENTNSPGGVAADGVTVSLWMARITSALPSGTAITITFSGAVADACCLGHVFTTNPGAYLTLSTAAVANEVTAATDFGSAAISGLSSKERLYFRAIAKEANTLLTITPTTNFSTVGGGRSNNSVTAVLARGEYRINTSTGETSDPTFAVSGDTAGVFVALEETYLTVIRVAPGDLRMRGPQIFDAPGPSILVGVAVLTLTMTAPTVLQDLTRLPAQGTLVFTGPAPTAPTVSVQPAVAPDAGALALTGAQPLAVIGGNTTIAVDVARLKFKGPAGPSPVYTFPVTALTLTGYEPTIAFKFISVPQGTLALTPQPFTWVVIPKNLYQPGPAVLILQGQWLGQGFGVILPDALVVTGQPPLLVTGIVRSILGAGPLAFTGRQPVALTTALPRPAPGDLVFTGPAPGVLTAYKAIPAPAALSLTGPAPQTIQTPVSSPIYVPDPDTLALTGSIPVVLANQTIPVPQGTLAFTGRLPTGPITGITQVRDPLVGTLTFSGPAPALNFFLVVSPGAGSVRFSGPNPALTGAQFGTGNTLYPTWQSVVLGGFG